MLNRQIQTFLFGFLGVLFFARPLIAATIYVDNTLSSNCTGETYSIANRSCNGSDGNAFEKIQDAIYSMSIGDTIYLRGGTYHENNSYSESMIDIPTSLTGDSWEEGHYCTLASYPGEWAIIDGQSTAPRGVVLGHKGMSGGDYGYWKFERLEITGGCSPGDAGEGGAGLWLTRGPFIVRYCYFHDNFDDNNANNPSGLTVYRLHNSIIEYNYFYRNGFNGVNGGTIEMYPDYNDESQGQSDLADIGRAQYGNHIRYNYFVSGGSIGGIKMKGSQMLGPNIAASADGGGWPRKDLGDKIHHNIFVDYPSYGVNIRQDFAQVYNNIFINSTISSSEYNQYGRRRQCFYNNTSIGGGFVQHNKEKPSLWIPPTYYSEDYVMANIIDGFVPGTGDMSYPVVYRPNSDSNYQSQIANVFNKGAFLQNYIYRPQNSGDMISVVSGRIGADPHFGRFTVAEYNSLFSTVNYFKLSSEGSDNIMVGTSGASQYISRGAHAVSGSITVANGGVGSSHPYLSGVTLPSYLGATNPDDHDWVAGVLALDATYMRQANGEPDWVEGSSNPSNTSPVAADDITTTDENLAVSIDALANDSDADADTLIIDAFDATTANGGTVADNGDGTLIYTPPADWYGTDIFYYTISDGNGGYDFASVTITVNESAESNEDGGGSSGCFLNGLALGV